MAAGLPVVATEVGGIPDFLTNEQTGLFCKVQDPKDLAKQVRRLMEDSALSEKIRKNGQDLVRNEYTWDNISDNMNTIFTTLCAS